MRMFSTMSLLPLDLCSSCLSFLSLLFQVEVEEDISRIFNPYKSGAASLDQIALTRGHQLTNGILYLSALFFSFFSLSPDSTQPLDVHIDYLRGGLHSLSSDFQVRFEAGYFIFISLKTVFSSFLIYSSGFGLFALSDVFSCSGFSWT